MTPPIINPNSPSLTTHYLRMKGTNEENVMSTGTGFIYARNGYYFLITNGHNVTRVNPETNKRISMSAAFPVKISTVMRKSVEGDPPGRLSREGLEIDLYKDPDFLEPVWLMHPKLGYKVDVIAIPIAEINSIPNYIKIFPINDIPFDNAFDIEIADDVFVLGYPFDIAGNIELPIWKRGSIATEPVINLDDLPKFLIDTATRPGMSGSPVIMYRSGIHGFKDGKPTDDSVIGTISKFAGIYSGRIGAEDNLQAQLGIVWKSTVIEEIIDGGILGSVEFQKL